VSQYTDFLRWQSGCRSFFSVDHGCTAGDSYHQGSRSYAEPFPCPNGLPIDTRAPQEVEWYRERVARAKADIEAFDRTTAIRDAAEAITDEEFDVWFEAIRKAQNDNDDNREYNRDSKNSDGFPVEVCGGAKGSH
jgi:hypothetical protein